MYWLIAILIIYILAGLYDERVFVYSIMGVLVIIGLTSLCVDELTRLLCSSSQKKQRGGTLHDMYKVLRS